MLCTKKASNRQCRKLRRLLAFLVVIVRSVVCDFPRDVEPGFCHFDHQRGCCDQKGQQRQQFRQCHPTFPLSRYTTSPGFDFKNKLAPRYNVPSMIFHETSVPPVRAAACVFDTAPYPPPFRRHFYCSIYFDELQHKTPPHSIQNCAAARSFYGLWGVYRITMVRLILSQE